VERGPRVEILGPFLGDVPGSRRWASLPVAQHAQRIALYAIVPPSHTTGYHDRSVNSGVFSACPRGESGTYGSQGLIVVYLSTSCLHRRPSISAFTCPRTDAVWSPALEGRCGCRPSASVGFHRLDQHG
jgi:hypothetical protein